MKPFDPTKTAEWYFDLDPVTQGTDAKAVFSVTQIQAIQLDAMREGMRRAAETINPCSNPNCGNDECDLGRKILTAAEQLTTKDL